MAIQVRRGNEVDFDPSKMLPGEWAVSLDTKYVRMCFSPGVCLRMATYEAFEADMAEIQAILAEAKTIQEAVAKIQTEINDTAVVVEDYSILAQSYAVGGTGTRENEDSDNAKYYYEQTKQISQGINGIVPMGTVTFANLPTSDIVKNAMYNVSDAFTSDERFNDGGGVSYGAGNNVIWTAEGKWDVTASSAVTGIKGANESVYRQGNVSLSAKDVGALPTTGGRIGNDDAHIDISGSSIVGDTNSQISGFDTISATYFDGDLDGTASKAERDKDGNDISEQFNSINNTLKNIAAQITFKNTHTNSFTWVKSLIITFNEAPSANHTLQIMTQEGNIALDYANGFRSRGGTTLSADSFSFSLSGNVLTITFSSNFACGFIISSKPFALSISTS